MNQHLAIQTENLTKKFHDFVAVDSLHLKVGKGEIYGFLGLNGAGKTTTIKAMLGLIRPTTGRVVMLGEEVSRSGSGPWQKVGHMAGAPAAYPELTVRENLSIAARYHHISNPTKIDRVISLLRLEKYKNRRAKALSTGNYQRLGLGAALIHNPELILLDEPINGLDPAGVVEIRTLLKSLSEQHGVTVFMSSHILSEVDRLANRIGIIHEGKLVEEHDKESLEQLKAQKLVVMTRNQTLAEQALHENGYAFENRNGIILLTCETALAQPDRIATILVQSGCPPTKLAIEQEDLEDHFLRLTGGAR